MDTNKILSADWLDILFDNRNKAYGAYSLRKSYKKRMNSALLTTLLLTGGIIAGATIVNKSTHRASRPGNENGYVLTSVEEHKDPPPVEKPKEIEKPIEKPVKTIAYTEFKPVPDDKAVDQPPTQDDLKTGQVDVISKPGEDYSGIQAPKGPPDEGQVLTVKPKVDDEGPVPVEIEAKFQGDWSRFLLQNLNPNVPAENNAPAGRYTVVIQFVVDKEGNVSDIKALTHHGYGLEEEAMRVIRKATRWEPGIQNGYKVKSYRRQPITFDVQGEE